MAITPPLIATGTTITFSSGFFAQILSMGVTGMERAFVPASHFGSAGAMTFIFGTLFDNGSVEVEMHYDPDLAPPLGSVAENCTLTFLGPVTNTTIVGSAAMTNFSWQGALEDKFVANATLKFSGALTITP